MKKGTGHWASGTGVKASALAVMTCAQGGCEVNMSSIHSDLTDPQIVERVQQRFHAGQPRAEVVGRLSSANLDYAEQGINIPELTNNRQGIVVLLHPAGVHAPRLNELTKQLLYWFSPEDRLAGVAYRVDNWAVSSRHRPRVELIPLRPVQEATQ